LELGGDQRDHREQLGAPVQVWTRPIGSRPRPLPPTSLLDLAIQFGIINFILELLDGVIFIQHKDFMLLQYFLP
jgi:hypothetical protein